MVQLISRRNVLAGAAALSVPGKALAADNPPILVELFTSQGCSSCPPADVLAGELMNRSDILIVSLNVDYWDYLGWKDTLARPEYTKRQRDYAKARGDGDVYTPQMVINGEMHAVGSRRQQVESEISACENLAALVPLQITVGKVDVSIEATASSGAVDGTLWLMSIAPQVQVTIDRGENAGVAATYHNVVRSLTPMGMYHGAGARFSMPRDAVIGRDAEFLVAVMQRGMLGQVIGLARTAIG